VAGDKSWMSVAEREMKNSPRYSEA
jgi:hypothetical protein